MKIKHKGSWLIGAVLLALLLMALWPTPRQVDAARVDRGSVRETVEAEARTRVRDRYLVSSPVSGLAHRLQLEPGARLQANQIILQISPTPSSALDPRTRSETEARLAAARAEQRAAEASAAAAATAAAQAKADAEREQTLAKQGLQAAATAEQAVRLAEMRRREAASARFQVAAAAEQVRLAQAALTPSSKGQNIVELRSPVSGQLLRRYYESETIVTPGMPLVDVGDPASLEVEVDVLSADAVKLRDSMPVELLRWGEPQALQGHVRLVEPAAFTKISALGVEEQRVWVRVVLDDPPERWQRLGDSYRLTARFLIRQANEVLRLPSSALFRVDNAWKAFRIDRGRARQVDVSVGVVGEGWAEILGGLSLNDQVVLHPERELTDGDRIAAAN